MRPRKSAIYTVEGTGNVGGKVNEYYKKEAKGCGHGVHIKSAVSQWADYVELLCSAHQIMQHYGY